MRLFHLTYTMLEEMTSDDDGTERNTDKVIEAVGYIGMHIINSIELISRTNRKEDNSQKRVASGNCDHLKR